MLQTTGVTVFTRLGFLPKVAPAANASRAIYVPTMHNHTDKALRKLCVRRVLNDALAPSGRKVCHSSLLLTADGSRANSKKRLSCLLVECIKYAYDKNNPPIPVGVNGHQTHKMAVTYQPTLRPFVQLPLGNPYAHLPSTTSSTPSPTPTPSLTGEF